MVQAFPRDAQLPASKKETMPATTKDELALEAWQKDRLSEALKFIEDGLAQEETPDRWNNWASIQVRDGNTLAGELGYRRALELEPRFGQAAANLGAIFASAGRLGAAIRMLERAVNGNNIDNAQREAAKQILAKCRRALAPEQKMEIPPDQIYAGYKPDELSIIREHFCLSPSPVKGFIVDRLGVKTRGSSLWDQVQPLVGTVIPIPIPNDYHAEAIEWIGLLKSVRSACGRFAAMELGAGWGPWVVAGAVAARNDDIRDISLLAVEGDPGHYAFLRQHFLDNGLDPDRHLLFQAAVGAKRDRARWPRVEPRNSYGTRPIPAEEAHATNGSLEVEVLPIADLLGKQERWDLVHVDVQGGEVPICAAGLPFLNERAHWLVIGTHSRLIEGELISLFVRQGWVLENEKPVIFEFQPGTPAVEALTRVDGTQVWRNPRLD
jgi:FkbM family methyltransferase